MFENKVKYNMEIFQLENTYLLSKYAQNIFCDFAR